MKFCDERIQRHLLNGGKITHSDLHYPIFLSDDTRLSYKNENNEVWGYALSKRELTSNDWEIVESKYNWNKIIKDKILCVFSDYEDYRTYVISPLIKVEDNNFSFKTIDKLSYGHCKPFNPAEYNIAKNIKDYEE